MCMLFFVGKNLHTVRLSLWMETPLQTGRVWGWGMGTGYPLPILEGSGAQNILFNFWVSQCIYFGEFYCPFKQFAKKYVKKIIPLPWAKSKAYNHAQSFRFRESSFLKFENQKDFKKQILDFEKRNLFQEKQVRLRRLANGVVTCKQQCRPTFTSWTWCRPTSVHKRRLCSDCSNLSANN